MTNSCLRFIAIKFQKPMRKPSKSVKNADGAKSSRATIAYRIISLARAKIAARTGNVI